MAKSLKTYNLPGVGESVTVLDVANTLRAKASGTYQERIPELTQENLADFATAMLNWAPGANEFMSGLFNMIGLQVIKTVNWENPLKPFKKGMLSAGDTIAEIFVDIAKAQQYTPKPASGQCADTLCPTEPNVQEMFHKLNYQLVYPLTINETQIRRALTSYDRLGDFIAGQFAAAYNADNLDEFLTMKQLFKLYYDQGYFYSVNVAEGANSTETYKNLAVAARAMSRNMTILKNDYNSAGVFTATKFEDQVIFMTSETEALMDVNVLAYAFHADKAELKGRLVVVDDLGGLEDEGVLAIMVDREWFMIYDTLITMRDQENALHLFWNYFYHHQAIFSTSRFANAVIFTTETAAATAVDVTPKTPTVNKGASQQFSAAVTTTGGASQDVTWEVTGGVEGTTITDKGLLTVAADETASSLTVKATSVATSTVSGQTTVTVPQG